MSSITNLLSSIIKVFRYGDRLEPKRDWAVLLGVLIILLVGGVVFNMWFFKQSENGRFSNGANAPSAQTSASISITDVQDLFKSRAVEESQYQHTYQFVDPSAPGS